MTHPHTSVTDDEFTQRPRSSRERQTRRSFQPWCRSKPSKCPLPRIRFDRAVPRAAAVVLECEVGPGAINSPGRWRNRRKGESESPPSPGSPQSLQKLGDGRLKAERRAKGRATGGWDAGIMIDTGENRCIISEMI